MPFQNDKEHLWVARFTLGKFAPPGGHDDLVNRFAVAEAEENDRKVKDAYVSEVRLRVEAEKTRLKQAFIFEIEVEGKKISTMGDKGDQTLTLDTQEAGKRLDQAVSMQQMKLMIESTDFMKKQSVYLEQPKRTVPGKESENLFTKQEIMDELYTPLVRELVIPENFVPDKYSEVQQMLDESNKFYIKQLEQYKEPESDTAEKVKTALEAVSKFTGAMTEITLSEEAAKVADTFRELVTAVLTTSIDGYQATRQQTVAGVQTVLNDVSGIVGNLLGSSDISKALQLGIKAAGSATAMTVHLTKDEPDIDGFLNDLIGVVDEGFTAGGIVAVGQTKVTLTTVSSSVNLALTSLLQAKKKNLLEKVKEGEWKDVASLVGTITTKSMKIAFKSINSTEALAPATELKNVKKELEDMEEGTEKNELLEKKERLERELEEIAERTESTGEALGEAGESFKEAIELSEGAEKELKKLEAQSEERKKAVARDAEQDLEKQLDEEREKHAQALASLGKVNPDDNDMKSIAYLISKIEQDEAIMKTALALSSAGSSVLMEFFHPLAGAGSLVQFVGNLKAAADRALAMRKWIESRGEAISAVSPYTTTIQNFVKNQQEQFSHYAIKAALKLAKAGAQFAGAAGVTAHITKAIEATVMLAETAEELIYKQYQERQLKKAWAMTKEALSDTKNRRVGLIARSLNPTLAKYTIAYGAVIRKDTIAVSAMSRIGLDRETLARRDSNVDAVKKFLDTLYKDDITVLGEYEDHQWPKGKPPQAALEVRVWLNTVTAAKNNEKLTDSDHGDILRALKAIEQREKQYVNAKSAKTLTAEMLDEYTFDLTLLITALEAYKPEKTNTISRQNVPAEAMIKLAVPFAGLAESRRVALLDAYGQVAG